MKNRKRVFWSFLCVAFLGIALAGCMTKRQVGKIHLYPDSIGVTSGQTIVLKAHNDLFDRSVDWKFQWQNVVGDMVTNIPEGDSEDLVLKKVGIDRAKLYRCMIYKTGDFGETNYTASVGLHVTIESIRMETLGVPTPISGPFKPGTANPSPPRSCCAGCANFMQLISSDNSIWWTPDTGASNGQFTYIPAPGQDGQIMVLNSGLLQTNAPWCGTTNINFPVAPSKKYQLIVCFRTNAPPKGTTLNFSITWNK